MSNIMMYRKSVALLTVGLCLTISTSLTGCAETYQSYGKKSWFTPRPLFLRNLPDGYDSYSIGFRDGCNTQLGTVGSGMLRNHNFNYDVNRGIEDRDYYLGYRFGVNYCTYHIDPNPI